MTAVSAIRSGRAAAERLMMQRVVVRRKTAVRVDGLDSFTQTVVFEGKCRVQTYEPQESKREAAGAPVVEQRYMLHLPVSSIGQVQVGDIATIEGRQRPLRVASMLEKTFQTAMRCGCDELTSEPL